MQDIFENFGIYLHVPFCAGSCGYCRFYKRIPTPELFDRYADAVALEINLRKNENGGFLPRPQTMFWGGGSPSMLPERHIERIAAAFGELTPSLEWSVEVAPTNATRQKLAALKSAGATRISMGVQSFNEKTLASLGRKHSLKATVEAVGHVAEAGFKHFSIDLIFGAKGQTPDEWLADIETAAACPVDHISAYCLEFESATSACGGNSPDGEIPDADGLFLEIAQSRLPELGFHQYEISNYAKPGAQCLHNLSTWHMAQWLGLGPSAASQWRGRRARNAPDFEKWETGIKSGMPSECDIVALDDAEMFSSALIFGLRMNEGVSLNSLSKRFPKADAQKYAPAIDFLKSQRLIEESGENIRLTPKGRLVADAVAVELL